MAIYYARANGNVNATIWSTTQAGTASNLFSSFNNSDVLMTNGFTVTFNVSVTVLEIRGDAANGATNGGAATLLDGVTITANLFAGSSAWLTYAGSQSATLNGSLNCGTSFGSFFASGTGTLNINGTVNGNNGTGSSGNACLWPSSGTVNIVGNIIGGTVSNMHSAIGSNGGNAVINVTGNITTTAANAVNLTGSQTLNVFGSVTAGNLANTVSYGNSMTLFIQRVVGNGFGNGSTGLTNQVAVAAPQSNPVRVSEIEYGLLGNSPTSGPIELVTANSNVAIFATRLGLPKTLVDLNNATNLVPASGNVRNGVAYNYNNNTGSCVIPNANSVVFGVPVDNTVGNGLLSPVAVWNALTSSIGTSGSIGERLKNCSTVSTVGKQLEGVL